MKRRDIPGGWYCDALPGEGSFYAALVRGSHIETSTGNWELPDGQDALFLRIGTPGPVLACCGARDDQAWVRDGHWESRGPVYGIHAVMFDDSGALLTVRDPSHPAAPQGFRQVADDGSIVYVMDTYTQQYPYEWTTHGDLTVGQGDHGPLGDDPCIARLPDGTFRLIEPGRCRMIRFRREGNHLAIAIVREDIRAAVIWWLTVAELQDLPVFTRPRHDTPVCNVVYIRGDEGACPHCAHAKSTHHLKEKEAEPVAIPNHFAVIQRIDAEHPLLIATNSKETVREFYWRAACALHEHDPNWGMLSKSNSENHQTIEGLRVSVDAVAYKGATPIVDILTSAGDGPGTGGITWGVDEHRRESNLWVQPPPFRSAAGGQGETGGGGTGGTGHEIEKLRDLVKGLREEISALKGRLSALEEGALQYGSPVVLRTDSRNVVCAEGGGGGALNATRSDPGAWETFVVEKP